MRSFLQLALDLFDPVPREVAAVAGTPREKMPNRPLAPVDTSPSAPELIASELPAQSLGSVMTPARFAHPRANRESRLCEAVVAYEFKRGRRRTIGMAVGADGLVVSAPRWVPLYEVEAALQEKANWIVRKLDEARERQQRLESARIQWQDGATFPFLGESVIVVLDPRHAFTTVGGGLKSAGVEVVLRTDAEAPNLTLAGVPRLTLHIGLPQTATHAQIRDTVQAWLMRQAHSIFTARLNHYAPQLQVQWRKLSLSSAGTRWGSARSDGAIRLNWRLIHFQQSVIDYVVAHELSHLRVMDHSPRFWDTVRSVMPDYETLRSQLKDDAIPRWH
ncbi:MAG: SprT family zinc-dependent metalloprotease [Rhodoferax sp.]|nr:SprT family zinc-dependent metalloprotease [Rhodoferax sp.]MDP1654943.1 SprT family zinc-dependent metalloprotease [Hylemonella sp.]MDP1943517.1 SprT family zinc-dependent metalloprotease [Rhodoferax sp.]